MRRLGSNKNLSCSVSFPSFRRQYDLYEGAGTELLPPEESLAHQRLNDDQIFPSPALIAVLVSMSDNGLPKIKIQSMLYL